MAEDVIEAGHPCRNDGLVYKGMGACRYSGGTILLTVHFLPSGIDCRTKQAVIIE